MLSLQNIHVHYGLSHIIHGIDLDVTNGEVVGIFGRNGVGKTTLLRTIAGWIKPSDGNVRLAGENIEGMAPDRICRKGVGFGSITLHPDGLPHGPQPGRTEASIGAKWTDELAVMLDTFRPLHVAKDALEVEDGDYWKSWSV